MWNPQFELTDIEYGEKIDVFKHKMVTVSAYSYRAPAFDGKQIEFDEHIMIERRDVVIILVHDPDKDKFILVEQLRPTVAFCYADKSPWILESPAGYVDQHESAEQSVTREIFEETGCEPLSVEHIASYCSPGLTCGKMHAYYVTVDAEALKPIAGCEMDKESIKTHCFSYKELLELQDRGCIISAHTLMLLFWYKAYKT